MHLLISMQSWPGPFECAYDGVSTVLNQQGNWQYTYGRIQCFLHVFGQPYTRIMYRAD